MSRRFRALRWVPVVFSIAACTAALQAEDAHAQQRAAATAAVSARERGPLEGAWIAQRYIMAHGAEHEVRGRIFFTERDWQVLFFVMDGDGVAQRGSAEGGGYTLDGDRLLFTHEFNLSGGAAMEGLAAADFSMTVRDEEGALLEPTNIEVSGDVLTLHFPSGNRMTFGRRR